MASAAAGANRTLGLDRGLPFPLADLGGAQAVLLLGSNLAETMPPAVQHLAGARAAGGLVVVDPRRSATADLTADERRPARAARARAPTSRCCSGSRTSCSPRGFADLAYLDERTTGLDDIRRSRGRSGGPSGPSRSRGVPAATLRRAAFLLANASPSRGGSGAYILTGRGVEQSTQGTDTVTAAITLALLLGLPGRVGSGYGAITGQGNGQGGREHGQKADQLPGYRSIEDDAARAHVAGVWGVDPADLPRTGMPAIELLRRLGTPDGPRALLVHGSNVLVSAPGRRPRARAARGARPARGVRLRAVGDRAARRRRPARHAVGGGGGHDDVARGPRHPAAPGPRRRRPACAASSRSSPTSPPGSGRPSASTPSPPMVFDELARASRRRPRRLLRAQPRAPRRRAGPVLAGPRRRRRRTPAPRGCSSTASRRPTAAPASIPVDHRGPSDDLRPRRARCS